MREPRYSVVIPVYNNEDTINRLILELTALSDRIGQDVEVIFVIDGSPDQSLNILLGELSTVSFPVRVLELSRNFGSFSAIRAGMKMAQGEYMAVISADLQEPPELIEEFFKVLKAGEADIVLGNRIQRSDPVFSRVSSKVYWGTYRRMLNRDIPPGGVDVFGCTRKVADSVLALPESNTSLIGLLYWMGFRKLTIPYVRLERQEGKSSWTFRRKVRYLTDSVYSFTGFPIVALQVIGILGMLISILLGVLVTVGWSTGRITETGYTPIMLAITTSTSAILLGLGIVGTYVWRTFENSKNRPLAIVRELYVSNQDGTDCE